MVEKLLFFIIAAEESVSLVKFSMKKKQMEIRLGCSLERRKKESTKTRGYQRQTDNPFDPLHSQISIMKNAANNWCDGGPEYDALRFQMIPCFIGQT